MAYKEFTAGQEALAADVNSLYMQQTVARFPSAAARTAAIVAPALNQLTMLDTSPGGVQYWNGTAWVDAVDLEHFYDAAAALDTTQGQAFAFDLPAIVLPRSGTVSVSLMGTVTSAAAGSGTLHVEATGGAITNNPFSYVGMPGANWTSTVPIAAALSTVAAGTSLVIRVRLTNNAGGTQRLIRVAGSVRVGQVF